METGIPRVEKVERRSEETTASEFHQTRCPKRREERDGQRGAWGFTGVPQVLIRDRHWGKNFLEGLEGATPDPQGGSASLCIIGWT